MIFFKKKNLMHLKCIRKLKKELPFFIYDLKSQLLKNKFKKSVFLKNIPSKFIYQILFILFVNKNEFGKHISFSHYQNTKIILPLPLDWLIVISKQLRVNFFFSTLNFLYEIIIHLIKSYIKNLIIILSFRNNLNKDILYFPELPSNLSLLNNPPKLNFFDKFKRITDFNQKIIIHNNSNLDFFYFEENEIKREKFCKNYLFINNNIFYKFYFFLYSSLLFLFSFFLVLFNKYQYALLYDELMKVLFLKNLPKKKITCFFNTGSGLLRPLWTHKQFFSEIDSYYFFYSINTATFKMPKSVAINHKKENPNIMSLLSWDNYLTCCEEQIEIIKKNLDKYEYSIRNIGNISFEGNKKLNINKKHDELIVSIFDVSAYRPRFVLYEQDPYHYYSYKNSINFYKNIFDVLDSSNKKFRIFYKQKRPIVKLHDVKKNNRSIKLNQLSILRSTKNITRIDSEINSNSLIFESDLVISMPYTTTSMIAKEYGIKTFFYDPSGFLPDHPLNKHIPLLRNKNSIQEFINNNF